MGERTCVREGSAGGGRTQPDAASAGCRSVVGMLFAPAQRGGLGARRRPAVPLGLRLRGLRRRTLLVDRGLALAQAQRGRVGARGAALETGLLVSGVHLDLPSA